MDEGKQEWFADMSGPGISSDPDPKVGFVEVKPSLREELARATAGLKRLEEAIAGAGYYVDPPGRYGGAAAALRAEVERNLRRRELEAARATPWQAIADARERAERAAYTWHDRRRSTRVGRIISATIIVVGVLAMLTAWGSR